MRQSAQTDHNHFELHSLNADSSTLCVKVVLCSKQTPEADTAVSLLCFITTNLLSFRTSLPDQEPRPFLHHLFLLLFRINLIILLLLLLLLIIPLLHLLIIIPVLLLIFISPPPTHRPPHPPTPPHLNPPLPHPPPILPLIISTSGAGCRLRSAVSG